MDTTKTKQQIIDRIQDSTNILVTVSDSPSVDELSAALGLTVLLNNMGKHATAIFSGAIPPAITFLEPEKTFEATTNSLRDFIIALDKEKADHLRYKLDGDMVKIFITPYRTTITSDDLEFSQGDYNVELVLALGVESQQHLDNALEAHGQILHDAAVVSLSAGETKSSLGSIDWHDDNASSLSEMVVGIVDGIKAPENTKLLDKQTATAFLTGIVAETDRFSNSKTSSKVMTVAAKLMAAGADQQLVAAKLTTAHEIAPESVDNPDESTSYKLSKSSSDDGGMAIRHEEEASDDDGETLAELDARVRGKDLGFEESDAEQLPEPTSSEPSYIETPLASADEMHSVYAPEADTAAPMSEAPVAEAPIPVAEPVTSVYTAEEAPAPSEADNPHQILTDASPSDSPTLEHHAYLGDAPQTAAAMNAADGTSRDEPSVDIFADTKSPQAQDSNDPLMAAGPASDPTGIGLLGQSSVTPAPVEAQPTVALPQPPPLPDFSQLPPPNAYGIAPPPPIEATQPGVPGEPARLGDILNEPAADSPYAAPPVEPSAPSEPPKADPGQFQIPGQN